MSTVICISSDEEDVKEDATSKKHNVKTTELVQSNIQLSGLAEVPKIISATSVTEEEFNSMLSVETYSDYNINAINKFSTVNRYSEGLSRTNKLKGVPNNSPKKVLNKKSTQNTSNKVLNQHNIINNGGNRNIRTPSTDKIVPLKQNTFTNVVVLNDDGEDEEFQLDRHTRCNLVTSVPLPKVVIASDTKPTPGHNSTPSNIFRNANKEQCNLPSKTLNKMKNSECVQKINNELNSTQNNKNVPSVHQHSLIKVKDINLLKEKKNINNNKTILSVPKLSTPPKPLKILNTNNLIAQMTDKCNNSENRSSLNIPEKCTVRRRKSNSSQKIVHKTQNNDNIHVPNHNGIVPNSVVNKLENTTIINKDKCIRRKSFNLNVKSISNVNSTSSKDEISNLNTKLISEIDLTENDDEQLPKKSNITLMCSNDSEKTLADKKDTDTCEVFIIYDSTGSNLSPAVDNKCSENNSLLGNLLSSSSTPKKTTKRKISSADTPESKRVCSEQISEIVLIDDDDDCVTREDKSKTPLVDFQAVKKTNNEIIDNLNKVCDPLQLSFNPENCNSSEKVQKDNQPSMPCSEYVNIDCDEPIIVNCDQAKSNSMILNEPVPVLKKTSSVNEVSTSDKELSFNKITCASNKTISKVLVCNKVTCDEPLVLDEVPSSVKVLTTTGISNFTITSTFTRASTSTGTSTLARASTSTEVLRSSGATTSARASTSAGALTLAKTSALTKTSTLVETPPSVDVLTSVGSSTCIEDPITVETSTSKETLNCDRTLSSNKESIKDDFSNSNEAFEKFINTCTSDAINQKLQKIINEHISKLRFRYKNADPSYVKSSHFIKLLQEYTKQIENKPENVMIIFNDISQELKARRTDKSNEVMNSGIDSIKRKHIKKLELALKLLRNKIKELSEKEINWDDDEDSFYLQEDRYKRRCVKVYEKLCELTGENKDAGRQTRAKLKFKSSKYPAINKAVTKLYRQTKQFPNIDDIETCIKSCVEENCLDFTSSELEAEIRNTFKHIGNTLQRKRKQELYEILNDPSDIGKDPAEEDSELRKKLDSNKEINETNMEAVIKKYTEKQEKGEDTINENEHSDKLNSDEDNENS